MTEFTSTIYGGLSDDFLFGTEENEQFYGNEGDDTINTGAGDDLVFSWTGDDSVRGEAGDDTITGDDGNDLLDGGEGADGLYGGIGDDTLNGGEGGDFLDGGAGADVFRFTSKTNSVASDRDAIFDYQDGLDKIDLGALGYTGIATSGTAAEGELSLSYSEIYDNTVVTDEYSDFSFLIYGNHMDSLDDSDFIFQDTTDGGSNPGGNIIDYDVIYAPILGQSNANAMTYFHDDTESGSTVLEQTLTDLTGVQTISQFYNSAGTPIPLGMGASMVDGNAPQADGKEDFRIWWYPDTDEPGGALLRAVTYMKRQLTTLEPLGEAKVALTWWHGEDSAWVLGFADDPVEAANRYRQATSDVFDYIKSELAAYGGADIDFYMIKTAQYDMDAAIYSNMSQENMDGLTLGVERVRAQQELLAAERNDVHIATNADDLTTISDLGAEEDLDDKWHYAPESYEILGSRLANFMSDELTDTGEAQTIIGSDDADTLAGGIGDDTITGNDGDDDLSGNEGADVIFGGKHNDTIDGGAGDDRINGQWGDDVVNGGVGDDLVNGYTGDDIVNGDAGDDRVYGASGNDTLNGGEGNDVLSGFNDNDMLDGGAGRDILVGGNGADVFVFSDVSHSTYNKTSGINVQDRIADFDVGLDMISLIGLGFTELDDDGGFAEAGELRIGFSEASTRTYVISDTSDFQFYLSGDYRLTLTDDSFDF